ncbi:MAG: TIGR01777 family oxidoreductase [Spirochaetes bacterium]|nr:TIGR01777 family oxidoreductase [Spirochaetota bacterium]
MNTIIITGGTGFIGTHLTQKLLTKGYSVIILTRNPGKFLSHTASLKYTAWDGKTGEGWADLVNEAYAIINLAGESIAGTRWTNEKKTKILQSRLQAGNAVIDAIKKAKKKPEVIIQASAIGYYGTRSESLNENSSPGLGFLPDVAIQWEASTKEAINFGIRHVIIRTGLVLGENEGLLRILIPIFKWYLGGYFGDGSQWMSWIHIDDEVNSIIHCLENRSIHGPVNAVSPNPVTAKHFYKTLAKVLHRPCLFKIPEFAITLMLGQMAQELILSSQKVHPDVLISTKFNFTYPNLYEALYSLLEKK